MKNKRRGKIRGQAEIPQIKGDNMGLVCEDLNVICENTIEKSGLTFNKKSEYGISSSKCDNGTPFDFGPSGGAIAPNTEVNAENQGVNSEVPRKPEFTPNDKK